MCAPGACRTRAGVRAELQTRSEAEIRRAGTVPDARSQIRVERPFDAQLRVASPRCAWTVRVQLQDTIDKRANRQTYRSSKLSASPSAVIVKATSCRQPSSS